MWWTPSSEMVSRECNKLHKQHFIGQNSIYKWNTILCPFLCTAQHAYQCNVKCFKTKSTTHRTEVLALELLSSSESAIRNLAAADPTSNELRWNVATHAAGLKDDIKPPRELLVRHPLFLAHHRQQHRWVELVLYLWGAWWSFKEGYEFRYGPLLNSKHPIDEAAARHHYHGHEYNHRYSPAQYGSAWTQSTEHKSSDLMWKDSYSWK